MAMTSSSTNRSQAEGQNQDSSEGKPPQSPLAVVEIAAIGALTAAAAFVLSQSVGWLGALRIQLIAVRASALDIAFVWTCWWCSMWTDSQICRS